MIKTDYVPNEKQCMFHSSGADELLYGGAAGGGKSVAIVMDALERCLNTSGVHAYLFRRTYKELEDSLIKEALMRIPQELYAYKSSKHELSLKNGSAMHFCHCDNEDDRFNYQGKEMNYLYIDELTSFSQTMYDFLKSRLRANKALNIRPYVRAASNPGGIGHNWVKQRFIDALQPYKVHEKTITSSITKKSLVTRMQYIPATVLDNPHVNEEYIFQLEQLPQGMRRAFLEGDWNIFSGQVFTEFRDNPKGYQTRKHSHVIEPFEIPHSYDIYRTYDFGYARPFSVLWFAVDSDGVSYLIREYYGGADNKGVRMTPKEQAEGILGIEAAEFAGRNISGIADPSIWDGSRGESIAAQFKKSGVHFKKYDFKYYGRYNDRLAGKIAIHQALKFDSNGYANLYIFNHCKQIITHLPKLCYDKAFPEMVDTTGEDHDYDALRYFLMIRRASTK